MACPNDSYMQKVTPVIILVIGSGDQKQEKDFYKNTLPNRLPKSEQKTKIFFQ